MFFEIVIKNYVRLWWNEYTYPSKGYAALERIVGANPTRRTIILIFYDAHVAEWVDVAA